MLIERGVLERRNGGWASAEGLEDVAIPDSVHGVIAARIDLLDASSRDALRRCSVVGRNFWPGAVGVDEQVIDSLRRTGLVSDSPGSTMGGMREFAFKHALTRDVVYSTLPRPERRELHRQVAEWVQDVARDRGVEAAELAAYHYGQALAYGEDDPDVARRAARGPADRERCGVQACGLRRRADTGRARAGARLRAGGPVRARPVGLRRGAVGGSAGDARPHRGRARARRRRAALGRARVAVANLLAHGPLGGGALIGESCGGGARRSSGVASAGAGTGSPFPDRDAEAPGRGDRTCGGGDRTSRAAWAICSRR